MPYGGIQVAFRVGAGKPNRFLASLAPEDLALLTPHLRVVQLERGAVLQEHGDTLEHVYFPHAGMISKVAVMRNGAAVESMTVGRDGMVGATAGLGSRRVLGKAIVQIAGAATRLPAAQFHAA